jgi:hypothetical protein
MWDFLRIAILVYNGKDIESKNICYARMRGNPPFLIIPMWEEMFICCMNADFPSLRGRSITTDEAIQRIKKIIHTWIK